MLQGQTECPRAFEGPRASQNQSFFQGYTASIYCILQPAGALAGPAVRVLVEPHGVEQLPDCINVGGFGFQRSPQCLARLCLAASDVIYCQFDFKNIFKLIKTTEDFFLGGGIN